MTFQDRVTSSVSELSIGSVTGIFGALLVSYWLIGTFVQYRKLQHVRGPWIAAVSPAWLFYHTCRGDLYLAVEAALKQYGTSA
jgi:hypothetical protein